MIHEHLETVRPITAKELCKITGKNRRELGKEIRKERKMGIPICASTDPTRPGFFIAGDQCDMRIYVRSLRSRIKELTEIMMFCERMIDKLPRVSNEQ